ncbi:uncharacterized protein [Spinacia oleracea]|nr:uncharacterized protein LOC110796571 isoform X2 [Spinacia oleracea]
MGKDVKATPVFELSSFTVTNDVFNNLQDENGCACIELYGHIKFIDDNSDEYILFDCDPSDPAIVYLSDNNSVLLRESIFNPPYWSYWMHRFSLIIYLKDKRRDIVVVDSTKDFDFAFMDVYDVNEGCWKIETPMCGLISVHYRILPYAVYAHVDVEVVDYNGSRRSHTNEDCDKPLKSEDLCQAVVTGKISSTCKTQDKRCISRVIFDESCYDPANLTPTDLLWICWLAVPAYSRKLRIEVDLEVDGEKIGSGHVLDFDVKDICVETEKAIKEQNWSIIVRVDWKHAYSFITKEYFNRIDPKLFVEGASATESEGHSTFSKVSNRELHLEVFPDIYDPSSVSPTDMSTKGMVRDPIPLFFPYNHSLVEIFSVSITPPREKCWKLCGEVECTDTFETYNIFCKEGEEYVELELKL